MNKLLCSTFIVLATWFNAQIGHAASAFGVATMRVVSQLSAQSLEDMRFPKATPGSPPYVLQIDDSESVGKFLIRGEPGFSISITLPSEISMVLGDSQGSDSIRVHSFKTSAQTGAHLDSEGNLVVNVGATRDALNAAQKEGMYHGTYRIDVIY